MNTCEESRENENHQNVSSHVFHEVIELIRSDESRRFPLLSEAEPQAPGSKPLLSVFLNVFHPQTHTTLHRSHEVKQVIKLCTCQTSLFDK